MSHPEDFAGGRNTSKFLSKKKNSIRAVLGVQCRGGGTCARITNEKNTTDGFNMFNEKIRRGGDFMQFFIERNKRLHVVAAAWHLTLLLMLKQALIFTLRALEQLLQSPALRASLWPISRHRRLQEETMVRERCLQFTPPPLTVAATLPGGRSSSSFPALGT